jgi:hypothetical protein
MALKLPPVVLALLQAARAAIDPALRANKAQLVVDCKAHGYVLHPAVAAFEAGFGGLVIPNRPKQKKNGPVWLFGTHACLASGAHEAPRGGDKRRGLIPVAYSPNGVIYFLDKHGRALAQDTIEDTQPQPFAPDGTALIARIMLYSALFALGASSRAQPGLIGDALSKRLSLGLIKRASGDDLRFFSDATAKTLVVENLKSQQTLVASADRKQLRLLDESVSSPVAADRARRRNPSS